MYKLRNRQEPGFGQGVVNSSWRGGEIFGKAGWPGLALVPGSLTMEGLKLADRMRSIDHSAAMDLWPVTN